MDNYKIKYHKYKNKYLELKNNQIGGANLKTYIQIITKDSEPIKINLDDEKTINNLINNYLENINELVCLDFHGVADLYNNDEKIPSKLNKCVISYIGGNPITISNTISTIKPRIINDEILFGIIVYNKNHIPTCGTKGWIISKMLEVNNNIKIYFIDDSKKNIECVKNVNSPRIKTFYVNKHKDPKTHLDKLLNRL